MVLVTPTSDVTSAPAVPLQDNTLAQLASQTPACWLKAQDFFVSWSGVLTLAYTSVTSAVDVCCIAHFII